MPHSWRVPIEERSGACKTTDPRNDSIAPMLLKDSPYSRWVSGSPTPLPYRTSKTVHQSRQQCHCAQPWWFLTAALTMTAPSAPVVTARG